MGLQTFRKFFHENCELKLFDCLVAANLIGTNRLLCATRLWLWTFTYSVSARVDVRERPIIMCNYLHFLFSFGAGRKAFSDTGIEKGIANHKLGEVKIVSG